MALTKQNFNINFSQGLDTKTDPFQVGIGKFLSLENTIFTKAGLLQKRNGYAQIAQLPTNNYSYLTTFNGDLTAIGNQLTSYSIPTNQWVNKAPIQAVELNTLSLVKTNTNQSNPDAVVAPNGLVCTVYVDQVPATPTVPVFKYVVADSNTGQNIVAPTILVGAGYVPRVYLLANYFVIVYPSVVNSNRLYFIAISLSNPLISTAPDFLSTQAFQNSLFGLAFQATVFNNILFVAWSSSNGMNVTYLNGHLAKGAVKNPDAVNSADIVSVTADPVYGSIWTTYYNFASNITRVLIMDQNLNSILGSTSVLSGLTPKIDNITTLAANNTLNVIYETIKAYSYDSTLQTDFLSTFTVSVGGVASATSIIARSVGLASKAFVYNGIIYFLTVYVSPYQSTYFLMNIHGNIVAELAYQNAGNYYLQGLPIALIAGNTVNIAYLHKDLIQAANKNTNVPTGSQVAGIYSQTGINLATFIFSSAKLVSAEIGGNLNINGGFLWAYDGYSLSENNFFVYPDSIEVSATTGGNLTAQIYFYQVTYEWSDNQGNLFRSAPSIPVSITLTSPSNAVIIQGPTLRLSLKNANNPVKIVIYRWSAGQEVYYQTTSIAFPLINNPLVDSFTYTDVNSDAFILGDNILYTNGGVLENIGPPAFDSVFLFDDRLWGIVSEDKNLLWFSKQVIEATPVEMSDLLTLYVAPTIGAEGSTGNLTCGAGMDDKLILFKPAGIYYINGTGPDNTGANNGYSQPTFITATVGCSNQKSIVFQPQGLMFEFQSDYGNQIWLLSRDLSSQYIGAPVEKFTTGSHVVSAISIPGTNEVRFTLDSGVTLMYDFYYGQWTTFYNIPAVSSTLFQGLQTYINSFGQDFQETPNTYLDGNNPVLMSFSTSWINLAGIQGYQRAYFFTLLGTYFSPHQLVIQIAYDYNPAVRQQTVISPDNFNPNFGNGYNYGNQTPYGGKTNLEEWKIYLTVQRCSAFQITVSELYDARYNVPSGAGFSLSGLNLVLGLKKGYRPYPFQHQAGSP